MAYSEEVDELLEELDVITDEDEAKAQSFFKRMERFVTEPWERKVRLRLPKKPLWWNQGIDNAYQRRRQLARRWHILDVQVKTAASSTIISEADRVHK